MVRGRACAMHTGALFLAARARRRLECDATGRKHTILSHAHAQTLWPLSAARSFTNMPVQPVADLQSHVNHGVLEVHLGRLGQELHLHRVDGVRKRVVLRWQLECPDAPVRAASRGRRAVAEVVDGGGARRQRPAVQPDQHLVERHVHRSEPHLEREAGQPALGGRGGEAVLGDPELERADGLADIQRGLAICGAVIQMPLIIFCKEKHE